MPEEESQEFENSDVNSDKKITSGIDGASVNRLLDEHLSLPSYYFTFSVTDKPKDGYYVNKVIYNDKELSVPEKGESKETSIDGRIYTVSVDANGTVTVTGPSIIQNNLMFTHAEVPKEVKAEYTVEIYYQLNGKYAEPMGIETRTGKTGTEVSVTDADKTSEKENYVLDESMNESVVLDLNGKTLTAEKGSGVITVAAPAVTVKNGTITGDELRFALCVGGCYSVDGTVQYLDASGFSAENLEIRDVTLTDGSECVVYIDNQMQTDKDISFRRVVLRNNTGIVIGACNNQPGVVFDLCDMRGNTPKHAGDELIWITNSTVQIRNSLMQENSSLTHGILYADTGADVLLENCLISDNLSWIVGGVYVNGGTVQFDGVVVKDNVGLYGAGGVQIDSGLLSVIGGAIYNNYLSDYPGVDVYLAEGVQTLIPRASLMQDGGTDFTDCVWMTCSGERVTTAISQPDGYIACGFVTTD